MQVVCAGTVLGNCVADRFRADLASAGLGDGHHSFEFQLPLNMPPAALRAVRLRLSDSHAYLLQNAPQVEDAAVEPVFTNLSRFGGLWLDRLEWLDRMGALTRSGAMDEALAGQLMRFARDGYLHIPAALAPATADALAARLDMPFSTLSKLENGKMAMTYDKLVRLAQGLGVDLGSLVAGDGSDHTYLTVRFPIPDSLGVTQARLPGRPWTGPAGVGAGSEWRKSAILGASERALRAAGRSRSARKWDLGRSHFFFGGPVRRKRRNCEGFRLSSCPRRVRCADLSGTVFLERQTTI
eukprot:gene34623-46471_t